MTRKKEPIDFLKVIQGIEKNKAEELEEAFKQARLLYLGLIEAGFTMEEAMTFLATLTRGSPNKEES
jgi:hypothetical protein